MVDVPTPIPETVVEQSRAFLSGTLLDVLWRLLVVGLLLGLAYLLFALGAIGAAVAGVLIGTLVSDEVRAFVGDLWRRDFWVWRT